MILYLLVTPIALSIDTTLHPIATYLYHSHLLCLVLLLPLDHCLPYIKSYMNQPPQQPQSRVVIYLTDSDSEEEDEEPVAVPPAPVAPPPARRHPVRPKFYLPGRLAREEDTESVDGLLDRDLLDFILYNPDSRYLNWRLDWEAYHQILIARSQSPGDSNTEGWWTSVEEEYNSLNEDKTSDSEQVVRQSSAEC